MEKNEVFLKYLIDEEIYIIEDKTSTDPGIDSGLSGDKNTKKSSTQKTEQIQDPKMKIKAAAETEKKGDDKPAKSYEDTTVLLLEYNDKTSISLEHKDLLAKILQSVNLDLDSVEMVYRTEFDKLVMKSFTNCSVIAFLPQIPKHISALFATEKYMINSINGNQFVAFDSPDDLNQNRSLKRRLWEQLKLIYGI